jgi:hypothetical protein
LGILKFKDMGRDIGLDRITGQANSGNQQFLQIVTSAVISVDFWAFTALGGNATITQLTNTDGTSALGYLSNGIAYQNQLYTGHFKAIKITPGVVKIEFNEQ